MADKRTSLIFFFDTNEIFAFRESFYVLGMQEEFST